MDNNKPSNKHDYSSIEITPYKIKEAYDFQQKNNTWTFYDERELEENIMANRYNYLLVLYGLFVNAFVITEGRINKIVILSLGLVITIFMSLTIYKAYNKLNINLRMLKDMNEYHVLPFINKEFKAQKKLNTPVLLITGKIVPCILIITYFIAIVLISFDIWKF